MAENSPKTATGKENENNKKTTGEVTATGKTRKKPEKHSYKYDALILEIRKVCPCNRTTLRNVAVEYMVETMRNEEGQLDAEGITAIAEYVQKRRPKVQNKVITGLSI